MAPDTQTQTPPADHPPAATPDDPASCSPNKSGVNIERGYDFARRKKVIRTGREKGGKIYISASDLKRAGFEPDEDLFYRVWPGSRGGITVQFYREG